MKPAEEYILNQPEPYRSILMHLQVLVEHTLPNVDIQYKWRLPFFCIDNKPICYFNHTKGYVDVGFWHSAHLTKFTEHLINDNRKVVKSLRYKTLEDINDTVFIHILKEANKHKQKTFYNRS